MEQWVIRCFLVTVIFLAIFLLRPSARRERAREYVLDKRTDFARRLTLVMGWLAENSAVREESLRDLGELKTKFFQIDKLNPDDEAVDWLTARRRLRSLQSDLERVALQMGEEIIWAERVKAIQVRLVSPISSGSSSSLS
jgi:hypothetical protein